MTVAPVRLVIADAPPSLNSVVSNGHWRKYHQTKKRWQQLVAEQLILAELPRGLDRVLVEGSMTFPDRRVRDQGNYRFIVEKALGDALVAGGHLEDDDWQRYHYGAR